MTSPLVFHPLSMYNTCLYGSNKIPPKGNEDSTQTIGEGITLTDSPYWFS